MAVLKKFVLEVFVATLISSPALKALQRHLSSCHFYSLLSTQKYYILHEHGDVQQ